MRSYTILIIVLIALAINACELNENNIGGSSDPLIGNWINPLNTEDVSSFEKSDSLLTQEYGFTFRENNVFIERKNAGWCGTPPVYHEDLEGTWERNDSIIEIHVAYWGGMAFYKWKINSLDNTSLSITWLDQEYNWENKYYYEEIFTEKYMDIYGKWKLYAVSGGFSGEGHDLNFEFLEISKIGMYHFSKNDKMLEQGKIVIDEQSEESLRISLEPDGGSEIIMHDSEKFVSFSGSDTLHFNAPCCDRYNYHLVRVE